MWLILKENYILNLKQTDNKFNFYLTNLINTWHSLLEYSDVVQKFKLLNPMFEMKESAITDKVSNLYNQRSNEGCHSVEKLSDGNILLNSGNTIKGFSYKMEIVLQPAMNDTFSHEFTTPLIQLLSCLKEREKELVTIIEAKDVELEEYRLEGVEIKRRNIVTAPFSYETFSKSPMKKDVGHPIDLLRGPLQELLSIPTISLEMVNEEEIVPVVVNKGQSRIVADVKSISGTAGCLYTTTSDSVKNDNPRKRKITTRTLKL